MDTITLPPMDNHVSLDRLSLKAFPSTNRERKHRKTTLRQRIWNLAAEVESDFLDTEDFCEKVNADFSTQKAYVKAERVRARQSLREPTP